MKFFQKIALRSGFFIFDELSMILAAALYILPVVAYKMINLPICIFSAVGVFLVITMRNRLKQLGSNGLVALVTLIHVAIGVFGILVIIVRNLLIAVGKIKRVNYAGLCWANERRYDDERAKEYGFKSVDDAINAGVMFDGTKLW
ncbi:MAG: hypothetical protein IJW18_00720 [Lachnospiraceae bacterium]|nr:hypothetical protein [Lachnospiraceae bacterium]